MHVLCRSRSVLFFQTEIKQVLSCPKVPKCCIYIGCNATEEGGSGKVNVGAGNGQMF